jgi:uncharacterized membrane protein YhaH (DUF805 family)
MDVGVFRIRFSGKCLPGFDENIVRQTLAEKLGFTPNQIASIFRGRPVTLKTNMGAPAATAYEAKLRLMGMDVKTELLEPVMASEPKTAAPAQQPPESTRSLVTAVAVAPAVTASIPSVAPEAPRPAAPTRVKPEPTNTVENHATPSKPKPPGQTPPLAATARLAPVATAVPTPVPSPITPPPSVVAPVPAAPIATHTPRAAHPETLLAEAHGTPPERSPNAGPNTNVGVHSNTHAASSELTRLCPRCNTRIPAARPCPTCFAKAPHPPAALQASRLAGEPLTAHTVPTPETQFLSTILAEQELMADHSTDRRTYMSLSFSGRMHGLHYLWWIGITYMLMRWLDVGDLLWRLSPHGSQVAMPPSAFTSLATCFLLFQAVRLSVLRLHDIDMSGLWATAHVAVYLILGLFVSITLASLFFQLGIMLLVIVPSDRHRNQFGSAPQSPDGTLEWFDSGRRCSRLFYVSRSLGVINVALLVGLLLGIGEILSNGIIELFFPTVPPLINPVRMLFAVAVIAAALLLRLMIARLHDISLRGTWILPYLGSCWGLYALMMAPGLGIRVLAIVLINLVSLLAFVTLCSVPGKPSSNRFGKVPPEPKQNDLWRQLAHLGVLCVAVLGVLATKMLPGF